MEITDTALLRVRILIGGTIIIAGLLLLPFMLSAILANPKAYAQQKGGPQENPNIITNGMVSAVDGAEQLVGLAAEVTESSFKSAARSVISVSAAGGKFVGHGIYASGTFVAGGVSGGFSLAVGAAGNVVGIIADTPPVRLAIRPADKVPVPVIDTNMPAEAAAQTQKPLSQVAQPAPPPPQADSAAQWPMKGRITARFGVPHRPYQPYHTGVDISDGQRAGVTPINPFKPGKVTETVRSKTGLGNHVVIDHGGGMTSIYAHLHSISVQVGQAVGGDTILGYEGSTGVSTGTHLHFEVRIDGKPVNPLQFIGS